MHIEELRVRDLMVREVITTSPNTSARDAWRMMEKNQIRHLPIVVDRRLVGMISQRELYLYLTTFAIYSGSSVQRKKPEELVNIRIEQIMSRDPYTISPVNLVGEAAQRMAHHRLSALPVVEEGNHLVGIITTQDILAHLSDEFHPDVLSE
ncbi:MAG: CBS domain-containing protein [Planctomycetota bacterium]|jgi:CBS domain-containing protein